MLRKLETIANLSVIIAALFFCVTIAKDRWLSKPTTNLRLESGTEDSLKGKQLKITGVSWNQADKTLVMACCIGLCPFSAQKQTSG
jgi:capsule polysaccharide export protein KpsE/RkpR